MGSASLGMLPLVQTAWASPALSTSDAHGKTIFPYGTHVYREPSLPLEQLRQDLPLLKQLGFNMIKIQDVWANDEPREGAIDLSKVAQIVADAKQNGLVVYFGVTMETAPAWLWRKYPDAHLVYNTGEPHKDPTQYVLPADGKPGPCWHHPGARQAAVRFIESIGREIGKFENIQVWNVWQEIGFWPMRRGFLGFCFCPYTLAEFRKWLQLRYRNLKHLNETWRTAFAEWAEIEPPRSSPQVPITIDWRYFMDDVYLTDALRWKAEAFRRSDPGRRPVLAHIASPTIGSTSSWRYAEALDIFGSSAYPAWGAFGKWDADATSEGQPVPKWAGLHHELWENIMMKFDYVRSSSRSGRFWTAELQGGPIVTGLNRGRIPDPSDIRRWVLGCLAAGSQGICFWNHRTEIFWQEAYGFGLLDLQGNNTPRAEEAGRLAKAINAQADLFSQGECPRPATALVMNEDLWHFAEGSTSNVQDHLLHTIRGIYRSLWNEGIATDFVEAEKIGSLGPRYKVLILPFPVALNAAIIDSLKSYVSNGGTLISEACPGRLSQYGMAFPSEMAPGVEELFGATHKQVVVIREPGDGAKWSATAIGFGDSVPYQELAGTRDFSEHRLFPAYYLQTLSLSTARPILLAGTEVAGCSHSYGQGHAYLVGTLLGHAELSYNDHRNGRFLALILRRAGVLPDKLGRLQRRERQLGRKTAWFVFNTTDEPIEETVSLAGFKSATDLLGETLKVKEGHMAVRVDPMDIKCIIMEN
jgi:beta-galactosidase